MSRAIGKILSGFREKLVPLQCGTWNIYTSDRRAYTPAFLAGSDAYARPGQLIRRAKSDAFVSIDTNTYASILREALP